MPDREVRQAAKPIDGKTPATDAMLEAALEIARGDNLPSLQANTAR